MRHLLVWKRNPTFNGLLIGSGVISDERCQLVDGLAAQSSRNIHLVGIDIHLVGIVRRGVIHITNK